MQESLAATIKHLRPLSFWKYDIAPKMVAIGRPTTFETFPSSVGGYSQLDNQPLPMVMMATSSRQDPAKLLNLGFAQVSRKKL